MFNFYLPFVFIFSHRTESPSLKYNLFKSSLFTEEFKNVQTYCNVGEWLGTAGANLLSRSTRAKKPNPNLATVSWESKHGKSKSTSPSSSAMYRA